MLVSEMIEWLQTKDQDAIVEVLVHTDGNGWYEQGGRVSREEFDVSEDKYDDFGKHWEYADFRGNQFVKESEPFYNKRYLFIGGQE